MAAKNINTPQALKRRIREQTIVDDNGCWIFQGAKDRAGYGRFYMGLGQTRRTHRLTYELWVGPIPEGLELDHLCNTPACCRPSHLEPVTGLENRQRGTKRRKRCGRGHYYSKRNTYITPQGVRMCRECRRIHGRINDAKRRPSHLPKRISPNHCFRGHLLTEENTYRIDGERRCRKCSADRQRGYRQAKKEVA
jgi:hypothetical protein